VMVSCINGHLHSLCDFAWGRLTSNRKGHKILLSQDLFQKARPYPASVNEGLGRVPFALGQLGEKHPLENFPKEKKRINFLIIFPCSS
jgi:hypothetical protein